MLIAKIQDDAVLSVADYRSLFPNTSFTKGPTAQFLQDNNCMKVVSFVDHDSTTHKLQSCSPYIDGTVVRTVEAVEKTAEDLAAENESKATKQRAVRNDKLAETDFYALSDVTMSAEMTTYRQALRDITAHENWPNLEEADWPTKP